MRNLCILIFIFLINSPWDLLDTNVFLIARVLLYCYNTLRVMYVLSTYNMFHGEKPNVFRNKRYTYIIYNIMIIIIISSSDVYNIVRNRTGVKLVFFPFACETGKRDNIITYTLVV